MRGKEPVLVPSRAYGSEARMSTTFELVVVVCACDVAPAANRQAARARVWTRRVVLGFIAFAFVYVFMFSVAAFNRTSAPFFTVVDDVKRKFFKNEKCFRKMQCQRFCCSEIVAGTLLKLPERVEVRSSFIK